MFWYSYFEKGCRTKWALDNPERQYGIWSIHGSWLLQLWNLLLLLSFSTPRHTSMASRAILSNFVEEQWNQNHLQYLSGLSQALFPRTVLEKAVYKSNTRLVISLEYPHSLTATFCFPELFQLITSLWLFFSVQAMNTTSSPLGRKF